MWQIDTQEDGLVLHADAVSRPLRLTRRATLEGSTLVLDYDLHNLSDEPTGWLWSAHPLLRVEAGDHVVLPDEVNQVAVNTQPPVSSNATAPLHGPMHDRHQA